MNDLRFCSHRHWRSNESVAEFAFAFGADGSWSIFLPPFIEDTLSGWGKWEVVTPKDFKLSDNADAAPLRVTLRRKP